MAVQNPVEVASADTSRPSWSWGNAPTEAPAAPSHGAPAAPEVEPPSVELIGRAAAPAPVAAPPAPARRAIPSLLFLLVVALLAMGLSLTTIMSGAAAEVVLGSAAVVLVVAAMSGLVRG